MTARKTTYRVTLPDGTVASRTSVRAYRFAIAREIRGSWKVVGWTAGDPAKAVARDQSRAPVGWEGHGPARAIPVEA